MSLLRESLWRNAWFHPGIQITTQGSGGSSSVQGLAQFDLCVIQDGCPGDLAQVFHAWCRTFF